MSGLRLAVYDAPAGGLALPGDAVRFVYCRSGTVVLEAGGERRNVGADEGAFADAAATLSGEGEAWIYEAAAADAPFLPGADLVLAHRVHPHFPAPFLLRADRIESQAGAQTPRHMHRGPGIRRLLKGTLMAEVGDATERIAAGDAWFETGRDPVVGTNIGGGNAAFVRVLLLPRELEGGVSSFIPADEAEAAKPRSVMNRLFGERLLPMP